MKSIKVVMIALTSAAFGFAVGGALKASSPDQLIIGMAWFCVCMLERIYHEMPDKSK